MNLDTQQVQLDDSQISVVEIGIEVRQVVAAGPGTGKTQVLAELAAELAYNYAGYDDSVLDIDVTQDLLVISFSRAAVDAMRKRTRKEKTLRGLKIQTIDSLAGQMLAEYGVSNAHLAFDERIIKATEILRKNDPDFIRVLRHVIVDEAQDIVGVRAEFVLEIMRKLNPSTGFTVLGDIHQAIFDFQIRGILPDDDRFIQKCRTLVRASGKQLQNQYRAQGEAPKAAMAIRKDLISDGERDLTTMKEFVGSLEFVGELDTLGSVLQEVSGTTLVLSNTNGGAWVIENALRDQGVRVSRRASAQELGYAPWIGQLFSSAFGASERTMRASEFHKRFLSLPKAINTGDAHDFWSALRQNIGFQSDAINTDRLQNVFEHRKLSFEYLAHDPTPVVVSTVHRAKGLEYDNVILMDPTSWEPKLKKTRAQMSSSDRLSLARTMYVACSRAAFELKRGGAVSTGRLRKPNSRLIDGRNKGPRALEVLPSDFDFFGIESSLALKISNKPTTYTFEINAVESELVGYPVIDMLIQQERIARSNSQLGKALIAAGGELVSVGALELFGFETHSVSLDSPHYNYGVGVVPRVSGLLPLKWSK